MRPWTVFIATALLVALAARPALGQTWRPERPYRGLFGGGVGKADQLLTLSGTAGSGYDDNILIGGNSNAVTADLNQGSRGAFGNGSAELAYSLARTRVSFAASIGSAASYYPVLQDALVMSHGAGIGGSLKISKRANLSANQTLAYDPLYSLASFPGLVDQPLGQPILPDYGQTARLENHLSSQTNVTLSETLSRRVGVSFDFSDYRSRSASRDHDVSTQSESGGLSIALARGLGLKLGYGYMGGRYGDAAGSLRVHDQTIDAGLDFSRALSLSRRVKLTFGTGSTAVRYRNQTQYFLTGDALLNREIGRTWNASLTFNRSVGVVDSFRQPVLSDSLTIGFAGLLNRQLQFHSSVGTLIGNVGFSAAANEFSTFGSAGLTIGLTRLLALGLDYSYYRYRFGGGVDLPLGLSPETSRQSVRANLNVWLPLVQRTRRSDAAR